MDINGVLTFLPLLCRIYVFRLSWAFFFFFFFLSVLKWGCLLYQNSSQGILCCSINLTLCLHELFLKACKNKTEGVAGVQEWWQQCTFCPDASCTYVLHCSHVHELAMWGGYRQTAFSPASRTVMRFAATASEAGFATESWIFLNALEVLCMVISEYVVAGFC